jgi:hypothetical protein
MYVPSQEVAITGVETAMVVTSAAIVVVRLFMDVVLRRVIGTCFAVASAVAFCVDVYLCVKRREPTVAVTVSP